MVSRNITKYLRWIEQLANQSYKSDTNAVKTDADAILTAIDSQIAAVDSQITILNSEKSTWQVRLSSAEAEARRLAQERMRP